MKHVLKLYETESHLISSAILKIATSKRGLFREIPIMALLKINYKPCVS